MGWGGGERERDLADARDISYTQSTIYRVSLIAAETISSRLRKLRARELCPSVSHDTGWLDKEHLKSNHGGKAPKKIIIRKRRARFRTIHQT